MSNDLRDHLNRIYQEFGKVTAQLVVEDARPDGSPLHGRFEWDNNVAGEAFRRQQAQDLIQSVRTVYKAADDKGPERSIRAWQAVRIDSDSGNNGYAYHPTDVIVRDALMTRLVMADMERDWRQLKARYDTFQEFWEMVRHDAA